MYQRLYYNGETTPVRLITVTWNWRSELFTTHEWYSEMTSKIEPPSPGQTTWPFYGGSGKVLPRPIPPISSTPSADHAPVSSPVHTPPQLFERGVHQYLILPLHMPQPHQHRPPCLHGQKIPAETVLGSVDAIKHTRFRDSLCAVSDDIAKCLYTSRSAVTNRHRENWAALFRDMSVNPLLVFYRDLLSFINAFA